LHRKNCSGNCRPVAAVENSKDIKMGQALLIVCRLPEQMYLLNSLSIEIPSAQKPTLRLTLRLGDVMVFENRQPVIAAKFITKSSLFIQLPSVIRRLEL
jgi:hypothetical protein